MVITHGFLGFVDQLPRIDVHLGQAVHDLGGWVYALVSSIVFVETGFVVAPFLPGDSLIFAAGAFVARGLLHGPLLFVLLVIAAALGDTVNYGMGRWCRGWVQREEGPRWVKKADLIRAQELYLKHGPGMIVLGRFLPVIRTLAPFVAGVGSMGYLRFLAYNVLGACLWVGVFFIAGILFGNMPFVRERFVILISGLAFLTMLPLMIETVLRRRADKCVRP